MSVRRFCHSHNIHHSTPISEEELDQMVFTAVSQVHSLLKFPSEVHVQTPSFVDTLTFVGRTDLRPKNDKRKT